MPKAPPKLSEEQVKVLIEEAQKTKPYKICGYITQRSDGTINVCKSKAGAGTHHVGEGRCRKHGGVGRPIVTGKYIVHKAGRNMKTLFEKAQELHLKQIQDHMETLRLIKVIVTELSQVCTLDSAKIDELLKSVMVLLKAEELQLKAQERNMFTFEQVASFIGQIIDIIESELKDPTVIARILSRIKEQVVLLEGNQSTE